MHYFTVKIPNKREPQQVVFKYSSDIEFEDFMNLYKNMLHNCSFKVNNTTLTSNNSLRFRCIFLERV